MIKLSSAFSTRTLLPLLCLFLTACGGGSSGEAEENSPIIVTPQPIVAADDQTVQTPSEPETPVQDPSEPSAPDQSPEEPTTPVQAPGEPEPPAPAPSEPEPPVQPPSEPEPPTPAPSEPGPSTPDDNSPDTTEISLPLSFVNDAPDTLTYGATTTFRAEFVDANGLSVPTSMLAAPLGATYDSDGNFSWTPTPLMLSKQESYWAYFDAEDTESVQIELRVRKDSHKPTLARSGLAVPLRENNLFVGNFDNDAAMEIMTTDSLSRIFTYETGDSSVQQDWLYPYNLNAHGQIVKITPPEQGAGSFLVVTQHAVNEILDRNGPPNTVYETDRQILDAVYADLSQSNNMELVLLLRNHTLIFIETDSYSVTNTVELIGATSQSFEREATSFVTGNVDGDSALEIVTSAGEVIDGSTKAIEWQHADPFGRIIAIGDIDGDGQNDLVTTDNWKELTRFDAILKSDISSYGVDDLCSLLIANVDNDVQEEIITADCQHGEVKIYDASAGSLELQHQYSSDDSADAISLTMGDADNDGIQELIFATGVNNSGPDTLKIATIPGLGDGSSQSMLGRNGPPLLDSFSVVGRAAVSSGNTENIFAVPTTENEFEGGRIVRFSDNGDIRLSGAIGDGFFTQMHGEIIDTDKDSIDEIILSTEDFNGGQLQHRRLDNFELLHTHSDLGGDDFSYNLVEDMTKATRADGTEVAILGRTDNKIQVYDIAARTTLWTSPRLSGWGINVSAIIEDSQLSIVATTDEQISKWVPNGNSFIRDTTVQHTCGFLQKYRSGDSERFACVQSEFGNGAKLTTFSSNLVASPTIQLNNRVSSLGVVPGASRDHLLLGGGAAFDEITPIAGIQQIDPETGLVVWTSSMPIGAIVNMYAERNPSSGETSLLIASDKAMYVTRH